jgi:hypothetical protein
MERRTGQLKFVEGAGKGVKLIHSVVVCTHGEVGYEAKVRVNNPTGQETDGWIIARERSLIASRAGEIPALLWSLILPRMVEVGSRGRARSLKPTADIDTGMSFTAIMSRAGN